MASNNITKTSHILPQSSRYPFSVIATHYTTAQSVKNVKGLTLVCAHAVGMHKESWEVTIQYLLEEKHTNIRDIYSVEIPNHGESAALNEAAIQKHPDQWPTRYIARAIYEFITAKPDATTPPKMDLGPERLVGLGHSIGAVALFLMREISPRVQFEAIIAVEPGISHPDLPEMLLGAQMLTAWTWMRQDVWTSRKSAKRQLESSPVHSAWDPRVLELYLKHGLKTHPASVYAPPFSFNGVVTCISKVQEAACFRSKDLVEDAIGAYTKTTQETPVHVVFGSIHDVGNTATQDLITDKSSGRTPVSVSHIEGAGHLAVQQQPEEVAKVIQSILSTNGRNSLAKL